VCATTMAAAHSVMEDKTILKSGAIYLVRYDL
jgi:hypothetical protein